MNAETWTAEDADVETAARRLLSLGGLLVDTLGRTAGTALASEIQPLEDASRSTRSLRDINAGLLPAIENLRARSRRFSWWERFTGEQLERDLQGRHAETALLDLTHRGDEVLAQLRGQLRLLRDARDRSVRGLAALDRDVAVATLLLSPAWAPACRDAGLDDGDLARLDRRCANLRSVAAALALSIEQNRLAVQSARAMIDRFVEIRSLLVPLSRQHKSLQAIAALDTHSEIERKASS